MGEYNVFDILGPIMIGPSSSHTAGACRIAQTALMIAGNKFKKVEFELHGSFAKTYKGHGTDRALLAGVLGIGADDVRLRDSFEIAKQRGLDYEFREADLGDVHPNTAKITFTYEDGTSMYVVGSSIGGGNIMIIDINGIAVQFTGNYPTLLLKYVDVRGIISFISTNLAQNGYNIESMKTLKNDGIVTLIVELDKNIGDDLKDGLLKDDRFLFTKYIQRN